MSQIGSHTDVLEENLIRHSVLNTIRSLNMKFGNEYGELVIATDNKRYWRKEVFPHYKASRKKAREESEIDWNLLFGTINTVKEEIIENFPYKVIDVDGAEADDVIGVLCKNYSTMEPVLILSSDKDFIQLQRYPNVKQYSPMMKKFVKHHNPMEYIREHTIKGDRGDGIPNFMSDDDTFVAENKRQKPISKKKLEVWLDLSKKPEELFNEDQLAGYKRNELLVDLTNTPSDIELAILEEFKKTPKGNMQKVFNYFIKNRMSVLRESLQEFRPKVKEKTHNTLF